MPVSAEEHLAQHGLSGSYQVHLSPVLLTIDHRAHQIFYGFDSNPLQEKLRSIFGSPFEFLSDKPHIVAAQSVDNPGGLAGLVYIVDRLLGPGGCPWDQAQTHESLKKYLLEESYELIQAIDDQNESEMIEELGDVLLQPLMHTQIKQLEGKWGIQEVAHQINRKLIRRHPHVFGDVTAETPEEVLKNWDTIKRAEKSEQNKPESTLSGVPSAMPALMLALEVSKRAARAGFEWQNIEGVWDKFREEELEFRHALDSESKEAQAAELGDLLFTVVNLARWAKIDPEEALRTMVNRFRHRFITMESLSTRPLSELTPNEWDNLWNRAKSVK